MLKKLGFELRKEAQFTKTAIAWGGRGEDIGKGKVQLSTGYSNLLGIIPFPYAGVRFGSRNKPGASLLLPGIIGIDTGARDSYKTRSNLKGLTDLIVEAVENKRGTAVNRGKKDKFNV